MPWNRPIPQANSRPVRSGGVHALVEAEKLMQIAILLPSAAFIGWLAGAWADSKFHQSWLGIAGVVLGGASGLTYVIRLAVASMAESGATDDEGEKAQQRGKPEPKDD